MIIVWAGLLTNLFSLFRDRVV
nr:hypothetical protein [Psychromonas aquimarina]